MTTQGFLTDEQVDELDADAESGPEPPTLAPLPDELDTPADEPQMISGGDLVHVAPGLELPAVMPSDEFAGLASQARVLASSALVPQALRGKPHDVFLVLLTGRDLGVTATSALRSCYVVDGKVTLAPALKKALIERQGLGAIRPPSVGDPDYPNSAQRATAIVYGPDGHELGRLQLTWADVENISDKGKRLVDKSNWKNYPQRMLWWRAVGWACDDYFSGVAYGLYSPDEVGGFIDAEGQPLDVDSVEVPDGFDRERERAKADPPIGAQVGGELAARATRLPKPARDLFRQQLAERDLQPPLADVPSSKRGLVDAMLSGLESRARCGEFGPPEAEAVPAADVALCEFCSEAPCVCAPGDDVVLCGDCGDDPCTCPL